MIGRAFCVEPQTPCLTFPKRSIFDQIFLEGTDTSELTKNGRNCNCLVGLDILFRDPGYQFGNAADDGLVGGASTRP